MGPDHASELGWEGKGDHEVGDLEEFTPLALQPLLAFVLLAMGATTMAARVGESRLMLTVMALHQHHLAVLIAAPSHRPQGLVVAG